MHSWCLQLQETDINKFLQQYEQYGGLAINWIVFGSSGHKVHVSLN
jgi:hypothetical protein